MSGAPKRGAHEEAVHSLPASSMRPGFGGEEEENPNPGLPRVNFGGVQQESSRPGYLSRPESRDGERRSPLNSVYKMPSSVSDALPQGGHPVGGVEIRAEAKDVRENKGVESSRDATVEVREVHHQGKAEKEGKVDESKEGKYEREGRSESKGEVKMDKDVYGGVGSHSNWKEQHRVKKHPDVQGGVGGGGGGMAGFWMGSSQVRKYDSVKHSSSTFIRKETDEAMGENRVDLKGEKERKRKEGKHHDLPEGDKDRSDFKSNVQGGGSSSNNELKEVIREDKESDQWGRERKDGMKEKERPEEREKDHVNKEGRSVGEKEGFQNDKEMADKASVQENFGSEQKKPTESWRNMEREAKERRREQESDLEGERPEKRSKGHDKELDEGGADAEVAMDRDRDAFGSSVQQRKRMLRPRGSPQVANRDGRFKSRGQDVEGSQGKPEVSTVYKVGECLQELTKLWKEFESSQTDKCSENLLNGPTVEIRIPAEHVTATNRQVRGGQLWGTDIYTNDSDLVAVLMHTGYCRPTASPPPPAIQDLRATIRVLPPQDSYVSTLRNNVRSRAWGAAIGCSYRVERCCIMKKGGGSINLEPCLTHTSTIEPTLAPVAVERSMTTRAAASNALRQQRFVREVTIQYNLCNEPWIKYSISIVADKGLKKPLYTSARLKKGEVLYLETHTRRYELCFTGEKTIKAQSQVHEAENEKSHNHIHSSNGERSSAEVDHIVVDMFRWSRCKKPLPQKFMSSVGIPLPAEHVEVLEENLDWEDVQWSQMGVWIAGKEYPLARVHFLSPN